MRRIRMLALTALSVFALGALTATAAQASEGPFWSICEEVAAGTGKYKDAKCTEKVEKGNFEKKRLKAGEARELTAEIKAGTVFKLSNGVQTLECTALKLKGGKAIGSTGATAGTNEEVIEFEGCTVKGNGEGCKVVGGNITTKTVISTLEFSKQVTERGDIHLVLFAPVKQPFVEIHFEGPNCIFLVTSVEGSVDAELDNALKEPLKLEENEILGQIGLITFPKVKIKESWKEKEGTRKPNTASLKVFGVAAKEFTGESIIRMFNKGVAVTDWGVFTH